MTEAQVKDLFIEWGLYSPREQREMIEEYLRKYEGYCCKEGFSFLKAQLEIEGYPPVSRKLV